MPKATEKNKQTIKAVRPISKPTEKACKELNFLFTVVLREETRSLWQKRRGEKGSETGKKEKAGGGEEEGKGGREEHRVNA